MFLKVWFWDLFAEIAMKMASNGKMSSQTHAIWGVVDYVLDVKIGDSLCPWALRTKHGFRKPNVGKLHWPNFGVAGG